MQQRAATRSRTDALAPLSSVILTTAGEYGALDMCISVSVSGRQHLTAVITTHDYTHVWDIISQCLASVKCCG
jgi:hypothetical protein